MVVWNNEALGQIRDDMQAADIPALGVSGRNPDFLGAARAFGAEGARASEPAALTEGIRQALARAGPTLFEANEADFLAGTSR